jgi:zinc transporter 1/2/3
MAFSHFSDAGAADADACAAVPLEDYNMGLRVGTIFIILGTSSIGKLLFAVLLTVK